ncbi:MAG: hypothetical protein ABJC10_13285 [Acidobacteriota bacterium]
MKTLAAILLCLSMQTIAPPQRNAFQVRYLGGSVETKTDKDEWNNNLTVPAEVTVFSDAVARYCAVDSGNSSQP